MNFKSIRTPLFLVLGATTIIPLLVLWAVVVVQVQQIRDMAASESMKLAYSDLDHALEGVVGMAQVQQAMIDALPADKALDRDALLAAAKASVRKRVLSIKVGQTGYVYVLDSKGRYVISQSGKRDGELILDAKDADGRPFIREIVGKARALEAGQVAEQVYPWKNAGDPEPRRKIARLGYYAPWDWIVGVGSYQDEFMNATTRIDEIRTRGNVIIAATLAASLLIAIALAFAFARRFSRPIIAFSRGMQGLADGDLTLRSADSLSVRRDEIGDFARALDAASGQLRSMLEGVRDGAQTVSASSTELAAISKGMTVSAQDARARADGASSGARVVSNGMGVISGISGQASQSIASVATAAEEMTSTIAEIASNTERARTMTHGAVESAARASLTMATLRDAATEIGKVTDSINAISLQTNILALNATIEAARSGAAGKGFAVVATEIKDLSRQTAGATEEIKSRIEGVQAFAASAVLDIQAMTDIVRSVDDVVTSIAAAIDEQSAVTRDIAQNIAQASHGVHEVNTGVGEAAKSADAIAYDILKVDSVTGDIVASSAQILTASEELSDLAGQLRAVIGRFRL